jgi:hypothetical protein
MKPSNFFEAFQNTQKQQLFESGSFSNTWNWRFFDSENFQIPKTRRYYKKSNTRPTLVFGSDACNAVNGLLLSHQTHSKYVLLYLLVPFAHGWSCWPV